MSNSLGTLNGSIIAQRSLDILKEQYPALSLISTDFSDAQGDYGQSVVSRIIAPGTAGTYTTTGGFAASALSTSDVTVTINNFVHSTVEIFPTEYSATKRNLVEEASNKIAVEIGDAIYTSIGALFTSGNFSQAVTQTVSGATRSNVIVAANTKLAKVKVNGEKFAILNPDLYGQLWTDESMVKQTWGAGGISENALPKVHGVTLSQYTALPTTGNLIGVVGRKDAIVIATKLPADVGAMAANIPRSSNVEAFTDADTGLTLQFRVSEDPNKGSIKIVGCLMYGVAVGNASCLTRIVSA